MSVAALCVFIICSSLILVGVAFPVLGLVGGIAGFIYVALVLFENRGVVR